MRWSLFSNPIASEPVPKFDQCLDQEKVRWLISTLPKTYRVLNEKAPWMKGRWPRHVKCMSSERIVEGRARGAGHGYTFSRGRHADTIWLNPHMTRSGYWLVFVHENLHHAYPDATEPELNCEHLPDIFERVFNKRYDHEWARQHGVGSPVPGVGDRSFCR